MGCNTVYPGRHIPVFTSHPCRWYSSKCYKNPPFFTRSSSLCILCFNLPLLALQSKYFSSTPFSKHPSSVSSEHKFFQKPGSHLKTLDARRVTLKQAPQQGPTNISYHGTKFSSPSGSSCGICAPDCSSILQEIKFHNHTEHTQN